MQKMTRDEIGLDFYLIYELSPPGVNQKYHPA